MHHFQTRKDTLRGRVLLVGPRHHCIRGNEELAFAFGPTFTMFAVYSKARKTVFKVAIPDARPTTRIY